MNLVRRMTLAIGGCAVILSGGAGLLLLEREERELRSVAQRETLLLGRSLQVAFENAIRDRQIEDVTETLNALSRVDQSVAVFVFDQAGELIGASSNAKLSPEASRTGLSAQQEIEPVIEFATGQGTELLRIGFQLEDAAPFGVSAVVLEKPLVELQRDLRTTRRGIASSTLLFVAVVALSTWFITGRYIGRPLRRLVTNMRLVRTGDLRILPATASADEVQDTQLEFEQLVRDLDSARRRADQESEARRRMERGLQEADKLLTLGQLSAVMAHEIGSPLQILEGRARSMKKQAADPALVRRTADMIIEQSERITRIVKQLLSLNRRRPPVRKPVDAEKLVRGVVALLELEARRRDVRIEVVIEASANILADADQLQQVALNLLRNALDAAPRKSTIVISLGGDDEQLVLLVSDEGAGVPESARPHLFEPFFTTKAASGGTGLGLSAVLSIAREHHGRAEFVDVDAAGCRVKVTLPRGPGGARRG